MIEYQDASNGIWEEENQKVATFKPKDLKAELENYRNWEMRNNMDSEDKIKNMKEERKNPYQS